MPQDGFLKDFQANAGNFARPYLFYVQIDAPGVSFDSVTTTGSSSRYLARSTNIPASTIESIEVPWQGMVYKMGSTNTYDTWSCTFNSDSELLLKRRFQEWNRLIHNPQDNAHGSPDDYFGTVTLEIIDPMNFDNVSHKVELYGTWPSTIDTVDLAYDNRTDVMQFDVTFTYLWHTEIGG